METKIGTDDYLKTHTAEEFEKLPEEEITDDMIKNGIDRSKQYFTDDAGYLCRWKESKDGKFRVRIANFAAVIADEVVEDDGVEVVHRYTIKGQAGKKIFPAADVMASQFVGMNWLHQWGTDAIIEPGSNSRDFMRHAIQVLSQGKTNKRHCYTHTGWRKINGQWAYLSNAGAIGTDGVNVKLSRELARYSLPLEPENEKQAIRASLSFLDIGKKEVTRPLYAATYLAPLTTLLNPMPNFSAYLYGQTGAYKTTISLLQLGHFGNFSSIAGLNNFDDSANSIEKRAFILKDTLLVLDDYHPSHRRQDAQAKESLAQRLIRSFSNRTARGRLNADTTDKGRYEPRGVLQITGEELVSLQSTLARILVVELESGDINEEKLTTIQQQVHLLPHAMTSYLLWIRDNIEEIQSGFHARFMALRNQASKEGIHKKVPEQTAFLFYALELVTSWLLDKGIYSEAEGKAFIEESWEILTSLAAKQARRIDEDDPVKRFADILTTLISSGNARIDHENLSLSVGGGDLIGYQDDEYIYLLPTPTWHAIKKYSMQEGSHFPFSSRSLYKLLRANNILIPNRDENTTSVKIRGTVHRVIKIYGSYLNLGVTHVTEE